MLRYHKRMKRLGWLLILAACAQKSNTRPIVAPPPPAPVTPPPIEVPPPPKTTPLADYQTLFFKALGQSRLGIKVSEQSFKPSGQLGHKVHVFKTVGRKKKHTAVTNGFGRVLRPGAEGEARRLELITHSAQYGVNIGKVLSTLGKHMHNKKEAANFVAYARVELPSAPFGMQFFLLLPGGEIDLPSGERVMLLKVVPLSKDEFETEQSKESQWVGTDAIEPGGAERTLLRWGPALKTGGP